MRPASSVSSSVPVCESRYWALSRGNSWVLFETDWVHTDADLLAYQTQSVFSNAYNHARRGHKN